MWISLTVICRAWLPKLKYSKPGNCGTGRYNSHMTTMKYTNIFQNTLSQGKKGGGKEPVGKRIGRRERARQRDNCVYVKRCVCWDGDGRKDRRRTGIIRVHDTHTHTQQTHR